MVKILSIFVAFLENMNFYKQIMLKRFFFLLSQVNAQKSLEPIAEHQTDDDTDISLILYLV